MKDSKMSKENLELYLSQPIDIKYELFHKFIDLAKLHYNELMEEELKQKAGKKYERGRRYNYWEKESEKYQNRRGKSTGRSAKII